jgi:hypothetical protein
MNKTELINVIISNNYVKMNEILINNQKIDWNICDRKNISILNYAIERRSKECFDLLLDNNLLKISNYDSNNTNICLNYYINAPNSGNEYYLKRLIEKGFKISCYYLRYMYGTNIFNNYFDKMNKTQNEISSLLKYSIEDNNIPLFDFIYDYINNNISNFWESNYKSLISIAITYDNIYVLNTIKYKLNYSILLVNNETPSLYEALVFQNSFKYILEEYKKLSHEELLKIPNINNIKLLNLESINTILLLNRLLSILSLNINFNYNDIIYYLINITFNVFCHMNYYNRTITKTYLFNCNLVSNKYIRNYNLLNDISIYYKIIYELLKNKYLKLSLNELIDNIINKEDLLKVITDNTNKDYIIFKNFFQNIIHIFVYFNENVILNDILTHFNLTKSERLMESLIEKSTVKKSKKKNINV